MVSGSTVNSLKGAAGGFIICAKNIVPACKRDYKKLMSGWRVITLLQKAFQKRELLGLASQFLTGGGNLVEVTHHGHITRILKLDSWKDWNVNFRKSLNNITYNDGLRRACR